MMQLFTRLQQSKLMNNLSWMMFAEVLSRLSRFVTLFVLAAYFSNSEYGLAMLALVIHEVLRVFTRLGTGAKIIQCRQNELLDTLQNAATLQWFAVLFIAIIQISIADWIAHYYQQALLADLLKLMALSHLFYPIVTVRIFEQHRENKLRYYGIATGLCIAFENLFIAALVYFGSDVFSVAYAKVAAALFWLILFIHLPTQLKCYRFQWSIQKQLTCFSTKTLVSELSRTLRFQADSLFAARLLSPELFGLYSFAKSAGWGISQSFSSAYLASLYPYLCDHVRTNTLSSSTKQRWRLNAFVCSLFIVQAIAAQFYVEWLFNERWAEAVNLVSILCLVAIPTLLIDQYGLVYRAMNKALFEMKIVLLCTAGLISAFVIVQPDSVYHIAYTVLATSLLWLGFMTIKPRKCLSHNTLKVQTI